MRLTRVHVPVPLTEGALLPLEPRCGAHLVRVLRHVVGTPLAVFDGAGREHDATIESIRGERVAVRIGARRPSAGESPLAIVLVQGVSRGERMDYAIQKATELGVHGVAPVICERSVVRLDAAQAARRLAHWRAVAASACEQCGRAQLPEIRAPRTLVEHLEALAARPAPGELRALLSAAAERGLAAAPATLQRAELLIGPEGGLTQAEERCAVERGYAKVRLGPRVLRTETAAAAAIAVLQALRGDLG
jgi:16S rRNA (uracil1498-N3)-methyltransferase